MAVDEFGQRRHAVEEGLAERKLDAFLVTLSPNLRYLSGFRGSNGCLLITGERVALFTDPRYSLQAVRETSSGDGRPRVQVRIAKGPLINDLTEAIRKLRVRRIGFEPARVTCDFYDALRSALPVGAALQPIPGWIEQLRMYKTHREVELIRRSVETNSRAFEQAVSHVRTGMKERDLAAELDYRMRRLGAERPAFETIVAGGARSALPHAQPSASPMGKGSLVVVDMGASVDGYASDMTRMLYFGNPGAKVKRTYRAVLEAQLAAIDAVRPGIRAEAVDRTARRVLKAHGLERAFIHSTGHGLGLEIHEPPRIGKRDRTLLQSGMTITIEPGVYLEGWGGIRIEDTVVVTDAGCDVLTPTSKDLRVI